MKIKKGQRKGAHTDESAAKLGQYLKSFIKANYGGNSPEAVVEAKLAAHGVHAGPVTVRTTVQLIEEQVETIRLATYPRIEEVVRRVAACDMLLGLFHEWLEQRAREGNLPDLGPEAAEPAAEDLP